MESFSSRMSKLIFRVKLSIQILRTILPHSSAAKFCRQVLKNYYGNTHFIFGRKILNDSIEDNILLNLNSASLSFVGIEWLINFLRYQKMGGKRSFSAVAHLAHNGCSKASKGLRSVSDSTCSKVEADYNPPHTTETLIGYTACCAVVHYFNRFITVVLKSKSPISYFSILYCCLSKYNSIKGRSGA